jgi:hypothetical protein
MGSDSVRPELVEGLSLEECFDKLSTNGTTAVAGMKRD